MYKRQVYTPANYSVKFTNLTGKATIGFEAVDATGNWLAVDNFRLGLIGEITSDIIISEVQRLVSEGESLQTQMMYKAEAQNLATAIEQAKKITATSTEADVASAVEAINKAIKAAMVAITEYQELQSAIDNAQGQYDVAKNDADKLMEEMCIRDSHHTSNNIQPLIFERSGVSLRCKYWIFVHLVEQYLILGICQVFDYRFQDFAYALNLIILLIFEEYVYDIRSRNQSMFLRISIDIGIHLLQHYCIICIIRVVDDNLLCKYMAFESQAQ